MAKNTKDSEKIDVIELSDDDSILSPPVTTSKGVKRELSSEDDEHSQNSKRKHSSSSQNSKSEEEEDNEMEDKSNESNNSDDDLLQGFPPVEVCLERCRKFVELTNTDEALAQFFLQDRNWDLEKSVADFFEESAERNASSSSSVSKKPTSSSGSAQVVDLSSDSEQEALREETRKLESDNLLKIISWNIDGLDAKNLELRTRKVCSIVKKAAADIVMLQEVVPETLKLIESELSKDYRVYNTGVEEYFTAMLFHRRRVNLDKHEVFEFSNSVMGRKIQRAEVSFKNAHKMIILNTHLESTGPHAEARKVQLQKCFRKINDINDEYSVLLAGDLNLRDKELTAIGGTPRNVVDVWEQQGSRREAEFTWDMTRNDNLLWNQRFKPKCRFDRMFFRKSTKQSRLLTPVYFGLIGLERLLPHRCFPSDHWGLYAHFKLE